MKIFDNYSLKYFIEKYKLKNYKINNNNSLEIFEDLIICNENNNYIPITISKIEGNLIIKNSSIVKITNLPSIINGDLKLINLNYIENLENCPKVINGNFEVINCKNLKSLYGAPKIIKNTFKCVNNYNLKTLENGPIEVGSNYICSNNNLINLKGLPSKINNLDCSFNNNLKTTTGIPKEIIGNFNCSYCGINYFDYPLKIGGSLICNNNDFNNFYSFPKEIGGDLIISKDDFKNINISLEKESIKNFLINSLNLKINGKIIIY